MASRPETLKEEPMDPRPSVVSAQAGLGAAVLCRCCPIASRPDRSGPSPLCCHRHVCLASSALMSEWEVAGLPQAQSPRQPWPQGLSPESPSRQGSGRGERSRGGMSWYPVDHIRVRRPGGCLPALPPCPWEAHRTHTPRNDLSGSCAFGRQHEACEAWRNLLPTQLTSGTNRRYTLK
ncbi:uncharacterized protein LOC128560186 [Nycticebus coucang]|uniref:uncharacterized protein LOC128560186 n=1 Tax=Nycticebus coucang TaxID=9470 RepID=UPI00234CD3F2|nr:uncharacterized protein LOC128560186 [Nycticebus coucang]